MGGSDPAVQARNRAALRAVDASLGFHGARRDHGTRGAARNHGGSESEYRARRGVLAAVRPAREPGASFLPRPAPRPELRRRRGNAGGGVVPRKRDPLGNNRLSHHRHDAPALFRRQKRGAVPPARRRDPAAEVTSPVGEVIPAKAGIQRLSNKTLDPRPRSESRAGL